MQKARTSEQGKMSVQRRTMGLFFLCIFLLKPKGGVVVAQLRTLTVVFFLVAGASVLSLPPRGYAASCEAIVGKWMWFIGGEVTVNPDGTFVQQSGNTGTWECTDAARGAITLRWRQGGFVNRMKLSPDGQGLSSTDPSQTFVTAKRIGAPSSPPPAQKAAGDAEAHANKAFDYYKKGMWDEAIGEYTKAIGINSKHADAYTNRGAAYFKKGHYDQAIADFNKAIEINPKLADAYSNRAGVYLNKDQYDQAIADSTKAIELDSKLAAAYGNRGDAYYRRGEYAKALDDLSKAQALGAKLDAQRLDDLRKATQASKKVTPEDSQEIQRLVQRISNNHKDTLSIELLGAFEDKTAGSIHRGLSVTREEGFRLVIRSLHCGFRVKDYRVPRDAVEDCDKKRNGLEWTETTSEPIPFLQIQPSSIKLSESNGVFTGSDPAISFGYEGYDPMGENIGWNEEGKPFFIVAPGPMRIECKNRSACEQMAADLQRLVEIVRKSTAAKTTEEPRQAQGNDSQEMTRLVERFTQNYHRDTPEFHWSDGSVFDDGHIRKGHFVTLEKDFTLVERYVECSIPNPFWGFGENDRIPAEYRMSVDSIKDCDMNSYGLKWEEKTVRRSLAEIDPSSITLSETNKSDRGSDPTISFGYESDPFGITTIDCKDRSACEQMATDLKRLAEMTQKSATLKKAFAQ